MDELQQQQQPLGQTASQHADSPEEHRYAPGARTLLAILVFLILVTCGAWWFVTGGVGMPQLLTSASGKLTSGNVQGAGADAKAYLNARGNNDRFAPIARATLAESSFMDSSDESVQGVALLKQNIDTAQTSEAKALFINRLGFVALESGTEQLFNAVFTGEPFASLRVSTSSRTSIENLANFSLATAPTSGAHLLLGAVDGARIIAKTMPASKKPVSDTTDGRAQLVRIAAHIDKNITEAGALAKEESSIPSVYLDTLPMLKEVYAGEALAAAARIDHVLESKAEMHFKAAIDAAVVNPSIAANQISARAHLSYALMLVVVDPTRTDDSGTHADAFLAIVSKDSNRFYIALAQSLKNVTNDDSDPLRVRRHAEFKALAAVSSSFKDFLIENGWSF